MVERLALAGHAAIEAAGPIATAGVGVPGIYDETHGSIRFFTNLPGPWAGHPLGAPLCEALGVPVRLINDARAFTLAEARVGAGKGCDSLIGVTLGTGVGGGIVLDGRLVLGFHGTAGEIGHQVIDCTPERAALRLRQHRLPRVLRRAPRRWRAPPARLRRPTRSRPTSAAIRARTPPWRPWIDYLAIGLANVVTVLTPDRIVLGGGVASAAARIIVPLRDRLRDPCAPDRPRARRDRVRGARRARGRHRRRPARPRAGVARRPPERRAPFPWRSYGVEASRCARSILSPTNSRACCRSVEPSAPSAS